jgi:hypothetical protein
MRPVGAELFHLYRRMGGRTDERTDTQRWRILDFTLSPCSECCISFGWFPGVWILYADFLKNSNGRESPKCKNTKTTKLVVTLCNFPNSLKSSTFWPYSLFVGYVFISEQTAIIFLCKVYNIILLPGRCVYCAVRTWLWNIILVNLSLHDLQYFFRNWELTVSAAINVSQD